VIRSDYARLTCGRLLDRARRKFMKSLPAT
jgi:hypothetical protein